MLLLPDDIDNKEEFHSLDIIDHQYKQRESKDLEFKRHTMTKMFEKECEIFTMTLRKYHLL